MIFVYPRHSSTMHSGHRVEASQVSTGWMECYSAVTGKGILAPAPRRMTPEDVTVSEISQAQRVKYCMILVSDVT